MTIRIYAERRQLKLARIEVRLRHTRRANAPCDIACRFERSITLVGELTEKERQKPLEINEKSPVSRTAETELGRRLVAGQVAFGTSLMRQIRILNARHRR